VQTAEFEIYSIEQIAVSPLAVRLQIRYDIVTVGKDGRREERVGSWRTEWQRAETEAWRARRWETGEETLSTTHGPAFLDVTHTGSRRNRVVFEADAPRGRLLAHDPGRRG